MRVVWTGLLLAIALPAQGIDERLARLVAIDDPAQRLSAAEELAKDAKVDLQSLRSAMQNLARYTEHKNGRLATRVDLWVGDKTEATDVHYYVPEKYDPNKRTPLLLIGHWTGGSGDQALPAWIRYADETGSLLVAPSEAGSNGGWAFSRRERESTRSAVHWMKRHFNVDENRITCTGVSRGGHLTWDLALRFPDQFAAIAPMIGGVRIKRVLGQNNFRYLENVVHLPIRDLQGAKDDRFLVANLRMSFKRLKELKAVDARLIEFPDLGHSYDMGAVEWPEFLGKAVRNPVPKKIVRMVANPQETRAFWVDVLTIDKRRVQEVPQIVATRKFDRLDEMGKRDYVARAIEKKTARLQIEMQGKGKFRAKAKHVKSFRVLLTPEMFDPTKLTTVRFKARVRRAKLKPSKLVLCREFALRFDRTFLPVAEMVVK